MKKIIQVTLAVFALLAVLVFCALFLTQCSMMFGNKTLVSDNLHYEAHKIFKECFASNYLWTSNEDNATLNIPDTCQGYRVTKLGGFVGSGGPCPFMVTLPNTQYICDEGVLPDNAQISYYYLEISIGKYIGEDTFIAMDQYYNIGSDAFVQILVSVQCSEENPYLYSKDGKLYRKSDDSLVDGFFYYSDYCD